jgi:hypothetical protein
MKRVFFSTPSKALRLASLFHVFLMSTLLVCGQSTKKTPTAPTHVQATDGVFTDRIDVSWTKEEGNEYRIYRGTSPSLADMKEVSRQWHTFNYFSDRTHLDAGKRYFYRVKTRKSGRLSGFSLADEGFTLLVAGSRKMTGKSDSGTPNALSPVEMTVNKLEKDTLKAGENFDISYALLNRSKAVVENTALYFYLSTDETLDKNDVLFDVAQLDPLSINRLKRGAINLHTDFKTPSGTYFILIKLEPMPTILYKKIIIK